MVFFKVLCQPRPPPVNPSSSVSSNLTPSRAGGPPGPQKSVKRIESEALALIVAAGFLYDTPCNR